MHKQSLNSKGFGITGVLAVVLVLVVIVGGGFLVYHNNHKTKITTAVSSSTSSQSATKGSSKTGAAVDPYAGWVTGTLQYEKATFRYPNDWQMSNASKNESQTGGVSNPGADSVTLTSPSGQTVSLETGQPYTFQTGNASVLSGAQSLKSLGGTYYLDFFNRTGSYTDAVAGCLDKDPTMTSGQSPYVTSKNITLAPSSYAADLFCVQYAQNVQGGVTTKPAATFEQDASFADAKLILESLTY
jgi:hypothetical protein